jgi:serine/threonine protein kinase
MAISVASVPSHPFLLDSEKIQPKHSMWHRWGEQFGRWLGKDDSNARSEEGDSFDTEGKEGKPPLKRRWSKRVGVGLPRAPTFRRQNSERRVNLEPVAPCHTERRAASLTADHRRALSVQRTRSPPPFPTPRQSAPEVRRYDNENGPIPVVGGERGDMFQSEEAQQFPLVEADRVVRRLDSAVFSDGDSRRDGEDEDMLEIELDRKWILNLSMHFRDKSDREKFFVTYAETPNLWRRVTVSCDYRTAEPDSLEKDLKELQFQRDKSGRIYESIRESLPEIQFYPTVTNLKLQTSDGRLHVHVTEDVNEIIPFPAVSAVRHLDRPAHIRDRNMLVRESELEFDAHLSGFVYKVRCGKHDFIKKEIPGPDTVDEFLYEINALHALSDSESVIKFEGVIVDDNEEVVKGLLISYAEKGALVDLLFDYKGQMEWPRRERWAKQIVQGLMEIHEAGYVQGDFTLSNIVVDSEDKAKIIDINRRGCPVGWEPPEISKKIESNQRISMYIGVKSDMYQLGMTLWALAMDEDEPERQDRPLTMDAAEPKVQPYYRRLVELCLADRPQDRPSAKELLAMFPNLDEIHTQDEYASHSHSRSSRSNKRYIDPSQAVEREDIARELSARQALNEDHDGASTGDPSFINPPDSSDLQFESSGSYVVGRRGRSGPTHLEHLSNRERGRRRSRSDCSTDSDSEPQIIGISPSHAHDFNEINIDGTPYLVPRGTFNSEDMRILQAHEPSRNEVEIDQEPEIEVGDYDREETDGATRSKDQAPTLEHHDYFSTMLEDSTSHQQPRGNDGHNSKDEEEIDLDSSRLDGLELPLPLSLSERTLKPAISNEAVPSSTMEDSLPRDLVGVGGHSNLADWALHGGINESKPVADDQKAISPNRSTSPPEVLKDEPISELIPESHAQQVSPTCPDAPLPIAPPEQALEPQKLISHDPEPETPIPVPHDPEPELPGPVSHTPEPETPEPVSHDPEPELPGPVSHTPEPETQEPVSHDPEPEGPKSLSDDLEPEPTLSDSMFASAHSQLPSTEYRHEEASIHQGEGQ